MKALVERSWWPVLISGLASKVASSEPIHLIGHQRPRISLRIHHHADHSEEARS